MAKAVTHRQHIRFLKQALFIRLLGKPLADCKTAGNTQVSSLTWLCWFQKHDKELVITHDILQGVVASIDGEKDPRCLMLSFQLAQQVINIYEQAAPQVRHASSAIHSTLLLCSRYLHYLPSHKKAFNC